MKYYLETPLLNRIEISQQCFTELVNKCCDDCVVEVLSISSSEGQTTTGYLLIFKQPQH